MSSLENRELAPGDISAGQLEKDIRSELAILEKEYGKQCLLKAPKSGEVFCGDKENVGGTDTGNPDFRI